MSDPRAPLVLSLPPSVNNWLFVTKRGRLAKTEIAVVWSRQAGWEARRWRKSAHWQPTVDQKIIADIWTYWPDCKIRDTHNLYKILFDALEGILYDNDRWVLARQRDFAVDFAHPRIEIFWSVKGESSDDCHSDTQGPV